MAIAVEKRTRNQHPHDRNGHRWLKLTHVDENDALVPTGFRHFNLLYIALRFEDWIVTQALT